MAISKIKLPDNSVQELRDSRMGNAKIFYGTCDTAAATVAKVVTCPDFTSSDLVKGALIFVTFDYTNSGAVANITMNVNNTGAKNIRKQYNTTGANNLVAVGELQANSTYLFQYNGTYWICMSTDYNNTYSSLAGLNYGGGNFIADSAVYRYQILVHVTRDRLSPFNNVDNGATDTTKTILTDVEFDPFDDFIYYNSTTTVSANAAISAGSCLFFHGTLDLRYSFNVSASVNPLTAHKDVYVKVIPTSNGKVKLAAAFPLVQDLPTTNDGYWYIFFGRAYSTYQSSMYINHPIYYHNGTEVVELNKFSSDLPDLSNYVNKVDYEQDERVAAEALNYLNSRISTAESTTNKVTTLSAESTDNEYPSAKLMYDVIVDNERVTSEALNDLNIKVSAAESTTNKVTSISSSSTDTEYASAKAIYDEIHPAVASSQPSGGFLPNVMYTLGTITGNVTFSLASAVSGIVNHYY